MATITRLAWQDRPIRRSFLPYCLPSIGEEEVEEVVQVLRSGWLTTGPRVKQFEERFAAYVGARYAVAVNSGTAAMHLVLRAWEIGPGDEVITTPLTFCATLEVIEYVGAMPVLVDIDPTTANLDPNRLQDAITKRTRVILPVHYGGLPCEMAPILEIARRYNLRVLDDAAHAAGAEYQGRKIGTLGDATAFSFYPTKNMTTAEGGMITTNDEVSANRCRLLALHGISRDAWNRYTATGSWYYEVEELGYKYNMTDLQAALGLPQLNKLDTMNLVRRRYAQRYQEAFSNFDFLTPFPLTLPSDRTHVWHLYTVLLNLEMLQIDRARFISELRARHIGTSVHFIPIHYHPHYRRYGWQRGSFPHAEWYYERTLSLPLYPAMSEEDVEDVIAAVYEVGKRWRR